MNLRVIALSLLSIAVCGNAHGQMQAAPSAASVVGTSAIAAGSIGSVMAFTHFGKSQATAAPEISGADSAGLVLLMGGIAVLRGRRKTAVPDQEQ